MNIIKLQKTNNIFAKILETAIVVFFAIIIFVSISNKNKLAEVFGVELNIIKSGSMSPYLKKYDFVVTYKSSASKIKQGDIVVFFDDSQTYKILHRVKEIVEDGEERYFITKGDNNIYADAGKRQSDELYAKFAFKVPFVGVLFVFLSSNQGIVIVILNACNFMFMSLIWKDEKDRSQFFVRESNSFKIKKNK